MPTKTNKRAVSKPNTRVTPAKTSKIIASKKKFSLSKKSKIVVIIVAILALSAGGYWAYGASMGMLEPNAITMKTPCNNGVAKSFYKRSYFKNKSGKILSGSHLTVYKTKRSNGEYCVYAELSRGNNFCSWGSGEYKRATVSSPWKSMGGKGYGACPAPDDDRAKTKKDVISVPSRLRGENLDHCAVTPKKGVYCAGTGILTLRKNW